MNLLCLILGKDIADVVDICNRFQKSPESDLMIRVIGFPGSGYF